MSAIFKIPYFKFCKLRYLHNVSTLTACKSKEDESYFLLVFSSVFQTGFDMISSAYFEVSITEKRKQ